MVDLVGTCPKDFWFEWIAEGDAAGDETPNGTDWGWYTHHHLIGAIRPGNRFYVVAHGKLRGYATVTLVRPGAIIRRAGAVAVTIDESIPGFQGLRERWWPRESEVPFPDWKTAGIPGMGSVDDDTLRAAFDRHAAEHSKFTRRMAIMVADEAGASPMSLVWRLEQLGLVRPGSWEWFKINGGITKRQIAEVRADASAAD